jgi:WXG100 family type VII secretion target
MPAYAVDLDRLDAAVALLAARTAVVDDALDTLDAQVAALHVVWSGAAAAAQDDAHRAWLAGARDMRDGLAAMQAAAATAHANYSAAVAANLAMWR